MMAAKPRAHQLRRATICDRALTFHRPRAPRRGRREPLPGIEDRSANAMRRRETLRGLPKPRAATPLPRAARRIILNDNLNATALELASYGSGLRPAREPAPATVRSYLRTAAVSYPGAGSRVREALVKEPTAAGYLRTPESDHDPVGAAFACDATRTRQLHMLISSRTRRAPA